MRVVHINRTDSWIGSSRASYRLHTELRLLGIESTYFVLNRSTDDPTVLELNRGNLANKLFQRLHRKLIDLDQRGIVTSPNCSGFSDDRTEYGNLVLQQLPSADVLSLHDISDFIDYSSFFPAVAKRAPFVWWIHEMYALTGGCHYPLGCENFGAACGYCPQLESSSRNDITHRIWSRKSKAFAHVPPDRLHIIAPSKWVASQVHKSSLLQRFPLTLIPPSVNTDDFAPRDQHFSRSLLNVDQDCKIILFVATHVNKWVKGLDLLLKSLSGLENERVLLVTAGRLTSPISSTIPHKHLGPIRDDKLLSLVYSAADVFVMPSRAETAGLVILESMACGTPVITVTGGAMSDFVRQGVTGYLSAPEDVDGLRHSILNVLNSPDSSSSMRLNCRSLVMQEYTPLLQAKRFRDVYEAVIAGSKQTASAN